MAPWDSHLRDNNTVGGHLHILLGVLNLLYFLLVGGEGHLIFIWEEVGYPRFYLKHPPSLPRLINLARGQLWHGHIFMDFSLNINFS